jgi:hypothetical protein
MGCLLLAVKTLLVLALWITGIWMLLAGLNVAIPLISFQGFEAHGVPIGFGLIIAGIAVLVLWRISINPGGGGGTGSAPRGMGPIITFFKGP